MIKKLSEDTTEELGLRVDVQEQEQLKRAAMPKRPNLPKHDGAEVCKRCGGSGIEKTIASRKTNRDYYLRRFLTPMERFMDSFEVDPQSGCWNWTLSIRRDYGWFWMGIKSHRANRASWMLFKGEIPDGLLVLHTCDNRKCVNPDHLFLGTYLDNTNDMIAKGRDEAIKAARRGEKSNFCKLTAEQAREIFLADGFQRVIGEKYGITQSAVGMIKRRRNWAFATKDL